MKFNIPEEENIFLVPEMPTPNGRMHLGHIAGPYLKMDVLKRKTTRNGAKAYMASGSDVYESYVELKSSQTGQSVEEVCNHFHNLILEDLKALQIQMDLFINPLDDKYNETFRKQHLEMAQELIDNKFIELVQESFAYDEAHERFLTGCWINGVCPVCHTETGSYLCENCGTHYKPQDIFEQSRFPEAKIKDRNTLFIKFDAGNLRKKLEEMGVSDSFIEIFDTYVEHQGEKIRLTTLQNTGTRFGSDDQVLFTYTALWFFSVFCGYVAKEELSLDENPFSHKSNFKTITSFGIDNAIPYLGGVLGASLNTKKYKPFDYFLANYFYYLNGTKFSTSRLHVIWGKDIVEKAKIPSDIVRYYLIKNNPQYETRNFDSKEFVEVVNVNLIEPHNRAVGICYTELKKLSDTIIPPIEEKLFSQLNDLLQGQNDLLDPLNFCLEKLVDQINHWIKIFENNMDKSPYNTYWWLKGYALLIYPMMPDMAFHIWKCLTRGSEITINNFLTDSELNLKEELIFKKITPEEIQICLPKNYSHEIN